MAHPSPFSRPFWPQQFSADPLGESLLLSGPGMARKVFCPMLWALAR